MSEDEANRIGVAIAGLFRPADKNAMQASFGDPTIASDVMMCAGIRAWHAATLRLRSADLATAASIQVQP